MNRHSAKIPLFKKIDQFTFQKIDRLKKSPFYQQFLEFLTGVNHETKALFKQIILVCQLAFPLLIILSFYMSNSNLKKELNLKQELLLKSEQLIEGHQKIEHIKQQVFSDSPIKLKGEMELRIRNIAAMININLKELSIEDFQSTTNTANMVETTAAITYQNLNDKQILEFLKNLISNEKIRIPSLQIAKNANSELLEGKINILHIADERY